MSKKPKQQYAKETTEQKIARLSQVPFGITMVWSASAGFQATLFGNPSPKEVENLIMKGLGDIVAVQVKADMARDEMEAAIDDGPLDPKEPVTERAEELVEDLSELGNTEEVENLLMKGLGDIIAVQVKDEMMKDDAIKTETVLEEEIEASNPEVEVVAELQPEAVE